MDYTFSYHILVLDALKIPTKSRNLSFLDGENILPNLIEIRDLNILFKKVL